MSDPPHSSVFHNANNISVLIDSTITSTIHNHESRSSGIHLLSQKISTNAMHDSSARDPPPRCHPDTRKLAINTIITFVDEAEPDELVMWMNAPFGHGKSAVVQTVIETLRASGRGHRVAGGFFFGRDKVGRDKAHYLLPTILYQIAHNVPGMYEQVNHAINADPTLPHKSIEAQLIPLLITPFQHCTSSSTHNPTVFIDGLDECDTLAAQRSVLKMIADAVSVHHIPLRLVIASRPEAHINQCFKALPLSSLTRPFELDEDFENMEHYFRNEFNKIYESRADEMFAIPKPWPSDKIVWKFTWRASGQYLFASTVIRFVGDEYENPVEQLQVLLTPHPRQSSAFSGMDVLYTQILSVCPIRLRTCLVGILGLILLRKYELVTMASLSDLLELAPLNISTTIRSLRAIIEIKDLPVLPAHNTKFTLSDYLSPNVSIRHISLEEFLTDEARAGNFWVDLNLMETMLCQRSDFLLASHLSKDSASSNIIHPATWRCLLCPGWPGNTPAMDSSNWPNFTREFLQYRDASSTQDQAVEFRWRSSKVFHFLLSRWLAHDIVVSDDDFSTIKSVRAASLRAWFNPLPQEGLDLFKLFAYFTDGWDDFGMDIEYTTIEKIKECPDLSFNAALRAISWADNFLKLDYGIQDDSLPYWPVMVTVDRLTMDILLDPDLIGEALYIAHRNSRLLTLSREYSNFLAEANLDVVAQPGLWTAGSVFAGPKSKQDIMVLVDGIDDSPSSTMQVLIDWICSPKSVAVLCDILVLDHPSDFLIPFFRFITRNCSQANFLGHHFQGIHEKLKHLIATLLSNRALMIVFQVDVETYGGWRPLIKAETDISMIYQHLSEIFSSDLEQWLDLLDNKTHDVIVGFFLRDSFLRRLCNWELDIYWVQHFSRANGSPEITKLLLSLHQDKSAMEDIGPFLPKTFISGVTIWKEKHLTADSDRESARAIDKLCLELSSMDRSCISTEDRDEPVTEANEMDIDVDGD